MQPEAKNLETISLTLEAALDLRAAVPLREILLQGLGQNKNLSIDAGGVKKMSTACVQVLTAFIIDAKKAGLGLMISMSSQAFDDAFAGLGLSHILESTKPKVLA
jgi:anti-anti-sigma regulatory factor